MRAAVEAEGLTKRYGDLVAVNGVSFRIESGSCFAFLGPNGAGKSTTIRMMCCLTPQTSGRLEVFGIPVGVSERRIKSRMGVIAQEDNLDPDLNVMENLIIYARFFGVTGDEAGHRALELLEFMQLTSKAKSLVRELSGGTRRRVVIARSLMNRPDMLVLDEPTTGLDPQARLLVWEVVSRLRSSGVTLVLTTHYMEEATRLADELVVIDGGEVLAQGTADRLIRETVGLEAMEITSDPADDQALLEAVGSGLVRHERRGESLVLFSATPGVLQARFAEERIRPERVLVRPANLEDVFLVLTGRELRD